MSVFGEGIIDRLNENCQLRKPDNPVRKIIDNSIGEWLDKYYESSKWEQFFLQEATDGYLDVIGLSYGVYRRIDESDDDYRDRIVYEALGHLTANYLESVYGLTLYSYVENFDVDDNTLVSDNPYLNVGKFMSIADTDTKNILNKKFIIGEGIEWVIL